MDHHDMRPSTTLAWHRHSIHQADEEIMLLDQVLEHAQRALAFGCAR
jgi:hypothetical protein